MLILRLIGILTLITIGVALALYVFKRDQRYLRFARSVFLAALVFAMLAMAFYAAERLLLAA